MKHPKPIQITIPQPCSEDWNKMTPQEQGRFCDSCRKCVVDFTGFTDEQLYKFFREHKGEKVCGRFQNWQLKRQVALPPEPINRFYKWFISLGFVIFLTELLSTEAKAQEYVKTESITGRVASMKGKPLKNLKVIIYNKDYSTNILTDNKGRFLVDLLAPGTYNIAIHSKDYKATTIENIVVETYSNTEMIIGMYEKKDNDTAQIIKFETTENRVIYDERGEGKIHTMGQVCLDERLYIINNPKRRSFFNWITGNK
jgi:hypothetical protein